jgi:NADPH:quinone reductase-like Zn-dependent oxidoreductase
MRALIATAYGPPEQLRIGDVEVPEPGPGQIQVRIAASTINPTDIRVIAGDLRDFTGDMEFPYIPGNEFAGTVTKAGAGVTRFRIGDEVFGQALPRQMSWTAEGIERPSLSTGALAEYAVFEAATPLVAHRPASVPPEQAAALAIAGNTARGVMALAEIKPGDKALVIGATGAVGTSLVPLAARAQAKVIATAATEEDHRVLRELGADETTGYDMSTYPTDVDVVFDLALPTQRLATAARALRPGGRLVTIMYPGPLPGQLGRDDVDTSLFWDMGGDFGGMRAVAAEAENGRLSVRIARRYPFDDAVRAAVDYTRQHNLGKIVVTMNS